MSELLYSSQHKKIVASLHEEVRRLEKLDEQNKRTIQAYQKHFAVDKSAIHTQQK